MLSVLCLFFFKQKTAYEMRISDWSSDVCSSDLIGLPRRDDRREMIGAIAGKFIGEHHNIDLARSARDTRGAISRRNPVHRGALHACRAQVQIGRASCRERVCQYV